MITGQTIAKIRVLKGMKQPEVAKLLDISQNAYSKIETGETNLSTKRAAELAKAFNMAPDDFMNFREGMVFNFHHQQGGNAGYITIHNTLDELWKVVEKLLEPYKGQISDLKGQVSHLEGEIKYWKNRGGDK